MTVYITCCDESVFDLSIENHTKAAAKMHILPKCSVLQLKNSSKMKTKLIRRSLNI